MVNQIEAHVFWKHNGYRQLMQKKGCSWKHGEPSWEDRAWTLFDFRPFEKNMRAIKSLGTHHTMFYSHHDPEKVEWLNEIHYDI